MDIQDMVASDYEVSDPFLATVWARDALSPAMRRAENRRYRVREFQHLTADEQLVFLRSHLTVGGTR